MVSVMSWETELLLIGCEFFPFQRMFGVTHYLCMFILSFLTVKNSDLILRHLLKGILLISFQIPFNNNREFVTIIVTQAAQVRLGVCANRRAKRWNFHPFSRRRATVQSLASQTVSSSMQSFTKHHD